MSITLKLLNKIRDQYCLNWFGTHGILHFVRVYENGMKLSEQEGVNSNVVQLFSIFHDSQRFNEHRDDGHGTRGGQLVLRLREYMPLDDNEMSLLVTACSLHTSTTEHDDVTVQACLDSDRLDLGRIGSIPNPVFLFTPIAKKPEIIKWAYQNSISREIPKNPFGISGYEEEIEHEMYNP